jgi:hypothetical protein
MKKYKKYNFRNKFLEIEVILRTKGTIAKESQNYLREKNAIKDFGFVNAIFNYYV